VGDQAGRAEAAARRYRSTARLAIQAQATRRATQKPVTTSGLLDPEANPRKPARKRVPVIRDVVAQRRCPMDENLAAITRQAAISPRKATLAAAMVGWVMTFWLMRALLDSYWTDQYPRLILSS
jgi:hypothetical protein